MTNVMSEHNHQAMADEVLQCLYANRKEFRATMHDEFQTFRNALSGLTGVYAVYCNYELEYIGHPEDASSNLSHYFITAEPGHASVETEFVMQTVDKLEIAFVEVSEDIFPQLMKHLKTRL